MSGGIFGRPNRGYTPDEQVQVGIGYLVAGVLLLVGFFGGGILAGIVLAIFGYWVAKFIVMILQAAMK